MIFYVWWRGGWCTVHATLDELRHKMHAQLEYTPTDAEGQRLLGTLDAWATSNLPPDLHFALDMRTEDDDLAEWEYMHIGKREL